MALNGLVYVVDDDPGIRDAMRCLMQTVDLDVACYASATDFLGASSTPLSGCLLLDLRIPDMSGLAVQRVLVERGCSIPVIFLTGHGDIDVCVQAMQQGACDFLTKPVNEERLLDKIRGALELSSGRQAACNQRASIRARLDLLTPRESQVLDGVVDGASNKQIAHLLRISPKTVELHRSRVMAKMHATSLAELVRMRMQINSEFSAASLTQSN